jgi:hypothetical protein
MGYIQNWNSYILEEVVLVYFNVLSRHDTLEKNVYTS